jgi:hypothetical protein
MKSGEPRKTKMNHSAGLRSQRFAAVLRDRERRGEEEAGAASASAPK